ncbi:hypothetical protein F3Y22_tig00005551pilonHSYRG00006 [Hibiscus syriacus]|uniref:Protein kinase domain-containing protein n=1 Tax=Hibiscus syriacus TaxID=106335 RepID=A0A6A3CF20_HIBSY|nr:hypothetical protein F3Y22_tig00005551pilonHSYRG00006 [Hibiscus syriacus]
MIEARGTIGYIAPEVFCRNIGSVSHKSDVYSYGMMILEMAGGRKNIDVGVHETSVIYFPHWIHQNLKQGNIEPELLGLLEERATVFCFLDFQEIRDIPSLMQKPVIDLLVIGQAAQSESQYAINLH